jgi:hypothetical protein
MLNCLLSEGFSSFWGVLNCSKNSIYTNKIRGLYYGFFRKQVLIECYLY